MFAANEHALQSPFAYHFYQNVVKGNSLPANVDCIEQQRALLQNSLHKIEVKNFGAPSTVTLKNMEPLSKIARRGISCQWQSALIWRLANWMGATNMLELGTSLGINTMYMAANEAEGANVITIEGNEALLEVAHDAWRACNIDNIHAIKGKISEVLPAINTDNLDLVYIDADHRSVALWENYLRCLPLMNKEAVMVVDDIRWSADMYQGWLGLCAREEVRLSLDLKRFGILFFDRNMAKKHHILSV
jgi:predicted O-methyltransferase YrrM